VRALSGAIVEALEQPGLAKKRGRALHDRFHKQFNWEKIAHLVEESLTKAKQS
jgi:glycosyltransferase involved in cell wall biosynthesis